MTVTTEVAGLPQMMLRKRVHFGSPRPSGTPFFCGTIDGVLFQVGADVLYNVCYWKDGKRCGVYLREDEFILDGLKQAE